VVESDKAQRKTQEEFLKRCFGSQFNVKQL
jgi:hypothetical protein